MERYQMQTGHNRDERGSAMIEFILVASMFLVPLLVGIFTYGFAVLRSVQVVQINRDVGHMYSRGVDFSTQANQNLLSGQLANGLNIAANSGNVTGGSTGYGEIVLSTLTAVASTCSCTNSGHVVVMKRIVIGNNTNYTTPYGSPSPSLITSTGDVQNYSSDTSARADNFGNLMTLNSGEIAYLAESYFRAPDLAVPGLYSGLASYQYAIF
jgi:hypothetical protein